MLFLCVIRFTYKRFKLRKAKNPDQIKATISKEVKPRKSPEPEAPLAKTMREQVHT